MDGPYRRMALFNKAVNHEYLDPTHLAGRKLGCGGGVLSSPFSDPPPPWAPKSAPLLCLGEV